MSKSSYTHSISTLDTDSLAYAIPGVEDVYMEMSKMGDYFDFSNYPKDHPLYSTANMKVVGKFKDELGGSILDKFVGLRPKLYAFTELSPTGTVKEKITAKGVKKSVKDKVLSVDAYEKCLFDHQQKRITMNYIRSSHHQVYSYTTNKIGLSMYDTKRWFDNDVTTFAFGHYKI